MMLRLLDLDGNAQGYIDPDEVVAFRIQLLNVELPSLDAQGNQMYNDNGQPIVKTEQRSATLVFVRDVQEGLVSVEPLDKFRDVFYRSRSIDVDDA